MLVDQYWLQNTCILWINWLKIKWWLDFSRSFIIRYSFRIYVELYKVILKRVMSLTATVCNSHWNIEALSSKIGKINFLHFPNLIFIYLINLLVYSNFKISYILVDAYHRLIFLQKIKKACCLIIVLVIEPHIFNDDRNWILLRYQFSQIYNFFSFIKITGKKRQ